jgi:hypothetical protein
MNNRKPLPSYFVPSLIWPTVEGPLSEQQSLSGQHDPESEKGQFAERQEFIRSYNELLHIQDLICDGMIQKTAKLCERLVAESDLSMDSLKKMLARIGENKPNHVQSSDLANVCGDEQHKEAGAMPVELASGKYEEEKAAPPCTKHAGNKHTAPNPIQAAQGNVVLPYCDPQLLPRFELNEGDILTSTSGTSVPEAEIEALTSQIENSVAEPGLQLNDWPHITEDADGAKDFSSSEIEKYLEY